MDRVADGVALHVEAMAQDVPCARRAIQAYPAPGRESGEKAARMLERVRRAAHSGGGEARGLDAALRRPADLEGLGHGAEIGAQAACHGRGDRQGVRSSPGVYL